MNDTDYLAWLVKNLSFLDDLDSDPETVEELRAAIDERCREERLVDLKGKLEGSIERMGPP